MATNILALAGHIQQQGEIGRARGTEQRLNRLTGQAMAAPDAQTRDQFVQQAVATDPRSGFALQDRFENQDERRGLKAMNAAKFVLDAYDSGDGNNVNSASQAYSMVRPFLVEEGRKYGKEPPATFNPSHVENMRAIVAMNSGGGTESTVQSTRVGADGYYYTVDRAGRWTNSGVKADPRTQLRDQPGIDPGIVDLRTGNVSPLQAGQGGVGGPPQGGRSPEGLVTAADGSQVYIDPSIPANVRADIIANPEKYGNGGEVQAPAMVQAAPQSGAAAMRRDTSQQITPYQQASLDMQRERLTAAQEARGQATAARKAADEAKALQSIQAASARQVEAATSANELISAIDRLQKSPGYKQLGTIYGGGMSRLPYTYASDSQAQLDNIAGQIALATMDRLKALSSQGATGFGALSEKELAILQGSIATLKPGISHNELESSLRVIREKMEKTANWKPPAQQAPASGSGVDDLLSKYGAR